MLRCFLEDAEAKKHTSAMVRNTIKEVKEIVLDAEDIVETFLLKEKLGNTSGIMKNVRRLPWVISERRELAFGIEAISKRISKVIRDMQSYGVQQFIVSEGYSQSLQEIQREMQLTFSGDEEDHLMGLEKNVEILVGYLVAKDSSHQVVSITGMGGLGKTTLARQIFKHETIKSHFPRLAWVCISQQFTRMYVWQTILRQLRPEYKVLEMTEDELQEKLVSVLETQKALIVIDDIWREGDWDRIKHVFLPQKGWKVLLTSRNEGVGLHADPNCVTFNTKCLTLKKSWTLFQRIAFPMKDTNDFKVDKEMEDMGKQMIKHCGSLPLALKVLGRLLAAKYTLRDWKRIYENIRSHIVNGTSISDINISSVFHVLYLSFEELPVYLKHCFLYLAHFPEDYKIDVGTLSYYWGAEGIQRPMYYDGASIRNVADVYIEELVKRNMVISERDVETSRFETCQLHDIMREVCLHQAEEENFLQIGTSTANSKSLYKSRRVAVHWRNERFFHMENPKLRSLVFISKIKRHIDVGINICFTRLPLMRVLDLSRVKFEGEKLPFSIGKLIHLRYLSLRDAYVNHLPSSMRNLKQLLYLNLCVGLSRVYMSNILKEMRELIYLHFPLAIKNKVKMELGNLVKLETLENFSTEHGSVSDLQCMTRLSTLSIYIRGKGHSAKTLSSSLSQLRCLEKLVIIDYDKLYSPTNDDEGFVLDCVHLKELFLSIYMPKLPDEQHLSSHLTTILLKKCYLKEDPMPILEKLSQLKEVSLQHQSFCGRRMVCSRSGFPQLQKLKLYGLSELEEWIVEEGSMPVVHTLTIRGCGKLELPDRLRSITSLKKLSVQLMGEEWKIRLSEGHLPSHLTTITLAHCRLEDDPFPVLEKLFHLKEIILGNISFCGRRMICSRGGFPQLQKLKLYGLLELEEWIVEEGSMPLLYSLDINLCCRLKELPDGLRFITSLEDLVVSMGDKWKKRLLEGGEDYYKVQHIPSLRIFK